VKLDRLGRSTRNLAPLFGRLDDAGIGLASLSETIDTTTSSGRFVRTMFGGIAELERDMITERTRSGVEARVRGGGWGGGDLAPYGFRVVGERSGARLEIDEAEAAVVREAAVLLVDRGLTTGQAADELNARGLLPRKAPRWSASNLRNVMWRGCWDGVWTFAKSGRSTYHRTPVEVSVPMLLDAERAAALREVLDATTRMRGKPHVHPLTGRLHCPRCGAPMTGLGRPGRSRRYRCSHGRASSRKPWCDAPYLPADAIDGAVWAKTLLMLSDPDALERAAEQVLASGADGRDTDPAERLDAAEAAVEKARRAVADATVRCARLGMDDDTTAEVVAALQLDYAAACRHRDAVIAAARARTVEADRLSSVAELAAVAAERLAAPSPELQRQVHDLLGTRVDVLTDGADGGTIDLRVSGLLAHDEVLSAVGSPRLTVTGSDTSLVNGATCPC